MEKQSGLKPTAPVLRHCILTIFTALSISALSAQDRIVLKNGNTLEARVTEIQFAEIKYKRFDNLNGPIYSLQKTDVFLIMYENGTKEIIGDLAAAPAAAPTVQPSAQGVITEKRAAASAPKQPSHQHWTPYMRKNIAIGGISLPLSADGLKLGLFAGYERLWPISEKFGITAHGSLSYNKLNVYYYDYYSGFSYNFKGGEFNTRIMAGPTFRLGAGTSVAFYSTGFVGANVNFFTGDFSDTPKTLSLAYGGGTGVLFNEVFDVGLRFISHTAYTATPMLYISAGVRF